MAQVSNQGSGGTLQCSALDKKTCRGTNEMRIGGKTHWTVASWEDCYDKCENASTCTAFHINSVRNWDDDGDDHWCTIYETCSGVEIPGLLLVQAVYYMADCDTVGGGNAQVLFRRLAYL